MRYQNNKVRKMLLVGLVLGASLLLVSLSASAQVRRPANTDTIIGKINSDPTAALTLVQAIVGNDEFGTYMVPTFKTWLSDGVNEYGIRFLRPYSKPARLQIVQGRVNYDGTYSPFSQLNVKLELGGGFRDRQYEGAAETFVNPRVADGGKPIITIFFLNGEDGTLLDAAIVYQYYFQTFVLGGDYFTDYSVKGLSVSFTGRFSLGVSWRYIVTARNGNVIDSGDAETVLGPDGTSLKVNIRSSVLYGDLTAVSIALVNKNTAQVLFAPDVTTIGQNR